MKKKSKEPELLRHITLPIKNLTLPRYDNPPQIEGDWAVCSDVHVPYYSEEWMARLVESSRDEKVKNLIIAGDFYNFDSYSTWTPLVDEDISVGKEQKEALLLLEHLFLFFKRILIVPGNHDMRLWKAENKIHKGSWTWEDMISNFYGKAEVHPVPYQYAILNNQTRITHPHGYSRIPARLPTRLADIYQQNIVSAGGHNVGIGSSDSGQFWGLEAGIMCESKEIAYKNVRDTTYPMWHSGYCIVKHIKGRDIPLIYNDLWCK